MKDKYELYVENGSIEFLNKLYENKKLYDFFKGYEYVRMETHVAKRTNCFKVYDMIINPVDDQFENRNYYFADYFYLDFGESGIYDESDRWIKYILKHLQGEERKKYLKGLQEFSEKMAQAVREDILKPAVTELEKLNAKTEDNKSDKRLIEQQIQKHNQDEKSFDEQAEEFASQELKKCNKMLEMGNTVVVKPEITEEEIRQSIESARTHDTEFGL